MYSNIFPVTIHCSCSRQWLQFPIQCLIKPLAKHRYMPLQPGGDLYFSLCYTITDTVTTIIEPYHRITHINTYITITYTIYVCKHIQSNLNTHVWYIIFISGTIRRSVSFLPSTINITIIDVIKQVLTNTRYVFIYWYI